MGGRYTPEVSEGWEKYSRSQKDQEEYSKSQSEAAEHRLAAAGQEAGCAMMPLQLSTEVADPHPRRVERSGCRLCLKTEQEGGEGFTRTQMNNDVCTCYCFLSVSPPAAHKNKQRGIPTHTQIHAPMHAHTHTQKQAVIVVVVAMVMVVVVKKIMMMTTMVITMKL